MVVTDCWLLNCCLDRMTNQVASLELWLDVMYNAMDAPAELGEQPSENRQWWAALLFVVFIVVGSFLVMNLFVGAVVDTFGIIKAKQGRNALLTESQAHFVASMHELFNNTPEAQPRVPEDGFCVPLRQACFKLVTFSSTNGKINFDNIIAVLIGLNILVMAAPIWKQPEQLSVQVGSDQASNAQQTTWNITLEWINFGFTWVFALEAASKLNGLGWTQYMDNTMNKFDLTVVLVSILGVVLTFAVPNTSGGLVALLMIFRVARVLRILRLAMRLDGIKRLLQTLLFALPALMNVLGLLVLVIFIFSILGMNFFGNNPYSTISDHAHYGLYNEHASFRYFHIAFFTLFRMSTGESWNGIMHDVMDYSGSGACFFFLAYMIIGSYLLLNLVIAILLDEFSSKSEFDKFEIKPAGRNNLTDALS